MLQAFLQYDFLQNAFISGMLIGVIAPVLGVFLVVRRLALIADALSHITLTGIAFHLLLAKSIPLLYSVTPLYMGMFFSVGGAFLIENLRTVYTTYKELAIPIILSGGIGIGVVFISLADGFNNDLFNYLFGSVISVSSGDVVTIAFITVIVLIVVIVFYKELFFLSFDEEQAIVSGLPKRAMNLMFILLTALVIAATMRIVGILLVSSLMTLPVAAAIQWSKSFKQMFLYSILIGETSVIGGLFSAYYFDLAPGGTIVICALFFLILSIGSRKLTGLPVLMPSKRGTL